MQQGKDYVVLSYSNLVILCWSGPQDPAVCWAIYDIVAKVATAAGSGKVAILSVVAPQCTPPSPEAREALSVLHEDPKQIVHRSAMVFISSGFISGAMRRVAMSILQRGNRRVKHDVFPDLQRALTWVCEDLPASKGAAIRVPDTVAALEEFLSSRTTYVA